MPCPIHVARNVSLCFHLARQRRSKSTRISRHGPCSVELEKRCLTERPRRELVAFQFKRESLAGPRQDVESFTCAPCISEGATNHSQGQTVVNRHSRFDLFGVRKRRLTHTRF